MRVATWNINHIHKRLDLLVDWLERTQPDVVALQELKTPTADFPTQTLAQAGYHAVVVGQRSWNGVALLGRHAAPLPVATTLPGDPEDKDARYVEAAVGGVLFACLYLPNGNPQPGPKFDFKLRWFERLRLRAAELWASGQPVVLLGDWNVVPTDADIYKPDTWRDNALLQPAVRQAYADVLAQGWTDALRSVHPTDTPFSFWDYRRKRWDRDAGLRIDHILVGARLTVVDAGVDRKMRGRDNASDHAPVWATLRAAPQTKTRAATATRSARSSPAAAPPAAMPDDPLTTYRRKRDFSKTAEPEGTVASQARRPPDAPLQFVVQKHWASRLHYDVRLELDGVMLSWAVPKGPSFDPAVQQMAIRVEDHPVGYNSFEGTIPKGQYGAGSVLVWDRGTWQPRGDPHDGLAKGKLLFSLHGDKLAGLWELVRISKPGAKSQDQWLLFKKRGDAWARATADYDVIAALPDSVIARPLGLVETREPRDPGDAPRARQTPRDTAADLRHARRAALPPTLEPQLATLVSTVPAGDWVVETKFDGYRMLARVQGSAVRLFTRNGHDWTAKLQPVVDAVAGLGLASAWLDGEIVVMNPAGLPDFNLLQKAIDGARANDITLFVFDAPFLDGKDLRRVPLQTRRTLLARVFDARPDTAVRFSQSFEVEPQLLLRAARQMGLEGVMVKRADAPYVSGRSASWLKLKWQQHQDFIVLGFTDRAGAVAEVGGLLLGYHDAAGLLRFGGAVGTGWDAQAGRALHRQLRQLVVPKPAVDPASVKPGRWSKRLTGSEHWVTPSTVVDVAFGEWTPDGHVRHPVFRGMRPDKPAADVARDLAGTAMSAPPAARSKAGPRGVKVTNADRVIDPSTGVRKLDLVRYYEGIATRMLPHLRHRPVSLVRAPTGITGELFFQKHPETRMPGLQELDPALWPGHTALLAVDSAAALLAAAQMNTVEFHTWNARVQKIALPDRFILDLDPGDGVTWAMLQEAALLTRTMLTTLGLKSWLKTSGGKGLHVVVPLAPKLDYDGVKAFSQAVVRHMAQVIPSRFVAVAGASNRVGKVFIDYLRNGHAQTTACAFSARARPGMGVSMPVDWDQLRELRSGAQWTVATAREYLSFQQQDPWAAYWKTRQSLGKAVKLLAS